MYMVHFSNIDLYYVSGSGFISPNNNCLITHTEAAHRHIYIDKLKDQAHSSGAYRGLSEGLSEVLLSRLF